MKKSRIILIGIILILLLVLYGPISYFRIALINTSMTTTNFKFIAKILYFNSYIEKVMNEYKVQTKEKTNQAETKKGGTETIFAEIKGDYYKGYIIKTSPENLFLGLAKDQNGEILEDIVTREKAFAGINASAYLEAEKRGKISGYCISNNKIIRKCTTDHLHTFAGLNNKNKLIVGNLSNEEIANQKFKWAVEFGPILIVNGNKVSIKEVAGGYAPRTAIGQTNNGDILLLVIDGRQVKSLGATYQDLQTIFYENGVINAIVLDGGSSSSMFYNGKIVNVPSDVQKERILPNAILLKQGEK